LIRPFDLRDIPLVRKLKEHTIALDSRRALIHTHRPLQSALWSYLIAHRGTPTLVLRDRPAGGARRAFGQVQLAAHQHQAQLVALAASPKEKDKATWLLMLDALTAYAGRSGAHTLLAEVADNSRHLQALRQAHFTIYTRQEIWKLTKAAESPTEPLLRPEQNSDEWHMQQLVTNVVPRLIQQVETVKPAGNGLIWLDEGRPLAYVSAQTGPRGVWLQFYLHPQAHESIESIIRQAAAHYAPSDQAPLFCCVRRYQEWLNRPLAELNFEPLGSQVVMVRHTTVRLPQLEPAPVAVAEPGLKVTTPMVRHKTE